MDNINFIDGIIISPLKIIYHEKGSIYHILRSFDIGFDSFGEVYISSIMENAVKAWKKHQKMTCNFVVPLGRIKIVVCDLRENSRTLGVVNEFELSITNYIRLTIPPGLWYGFKGLECGNNLLVNVSNIPHDKGEQENVDPEIFQINYNW